MTIAEDEQRTPFSFAIIEIVFLDKQCLFKPHLTEVETNLILDFFLNLLGYFASVRASCIVKFFCCLIFTDWSIATIQNGFNLQNQNISSHIIL